MRDIDVSIKRQDNRFKPCDIVIRVGNMEAATVIHSLFNHSYVLEACGMNHLCQPVHKILADHGVDKEEAEEMFKKIDKAMRTQFTKGYVKEEAVESDTSNFIKKLKILMNRYDVEFRVETTPNWFKLVCDHSGGEEVMGEGATGTTSHINHDTWMK